MSTTVTKIADAAFDAVDVAVTDVIFDATVTYQTQGTYDPSTGTYSVTTTTLTGRALFDTDTPARDIFPDAIIGSNRQLVLFEGFSETIKEGYKLTISTIDYEIKAAQKIVGSLSLQYGVALQK
tara:strand:- start:1789 stop:2160 length:372 start_codon:yes stop_codon:yes gene_type:complete